MLKASLWMTVCLVLCLSITVFAVPVGSSETLMKAQERLKQLGYEPGPADGTRGAQTTAALKKFQQDNRLKPTGTLDRETMRALGLNAAQNVQDAETSRAAGQSQDMKEREIVDLLAEKKIEVKTQGSNIEEVRLEMRRLVDYEITVRIPVGTFLVSRNPSAQNMVLTSETKQTLQTKNWVSLSLPAACANRSRAIPGNNDTFTVQRSSHQEELARLMPVLDNARVPYTVRQAGVWIVTDNADYEALGSLISRPAWQQSGGTRRIEEKEAAEAMRICAQAGIDVRRKAIWKDHELIYWRLEEGEAKSWIGSQDTALLQKAQSTERTIATRLASISEATSTSFAEKRLKIYVLLVATSTRAPDAAYLASYLRKQGHEVAVGTGTPEIIHSAISWNLVPLFAQRSGLVICFQQQFENQAERLSKVLSIMFATKVASTAMREGGYSSPEPTKDLVIIWGD